jgi:hypothetical protein
MASVGGAWPPTGGSRWRRPASLRTRPHGVRRGLHVAGVIGTLERVGLRHRVRCRLVRSERCRIGALARASTLVLPAVRSAGEPAISGTAKPRSDGITARADSGRSRAELSLAETDYGAGDIERGPAALERFTSRRCGDCERAAAFIGPVLRCRAERSATGRSRATARSATPTPATC